MDNRYEIITWRGRRFDRMTVQGLEAAERELGYELSITQGSYNAGRVSKSAGTHDGGGAGDLPPFEAERKVRVLRKWGFAAWVRRPSQGPWNAHVHFVQIGNDRAAPSAKRQVASFLRGRNGLKGDGRDDGPKVARVPFRYQARLYKPGRRVLRLGAYGPDVESVQRQLGLYVDGDYGPQTSAAVAAWQRKRKIVPVNGKVGPRTWASLTLAARKAKR